MADGLVLTHGAVGNARVPLLVALAAAFEARGLVVHRYDLPFRQARPTGPPTALLPAAGAGHDLFRGRTPAAADAIAEAFLAFVGRLTAENTR